MLPSLAAIAGWIGVAALVGSIAWIAFRFIYEVEDFIASKLREDALGDRPEGDWPHVPSDLKVLFHSGTDSRKER